MTPEPTIGSPVTPKLPDWVHSIGKRLRHDLNSDMTDMPEKVMSTLLRLFQREHYATRKDSADREKGQEDGSKSG